MKFDKRKKSDLSKYSMYASVFAVLFSAVGWMGTDIWLASTQWLLVALVLLALSIYLKLS